MRILAIDPGYDRCGIAVIEKGKLVSSACITTNKKDVLSERLALIYDGICKIIEESRPDTLAIETLIVSLNKKTVIQVAESRGVALLAAGKNNLPVIEVSPQQVKISMTGIGNASKEQVQKMVSLTLNIDISKKLDDEIDAIAVGFAALGELKIGIMTKNL